MRKYILIGALAFLVVTVVWVPASIVRLATNRVDGLGLRTVGGTLWRGEAHVVYRGQAVGKLGWRFAPRGLLDGEARVRWQLTDADLDLTGTAARGLDLGRLTASGHVGAAAVNRVLGRYDISIDGDFAVSDFTAASDGALRVRGAISWPGGRTFYRLSGQNYDTVLPAMIAALGTVDGEHTLRASLADGSDRPLIHARLRSTGWLEIALTRRFTALAGKPWPVRGDDDAVVLTVEEQLLP